MRLINSKPIHLFKNLYYSKIAIIQDENISIFLKYREIEIVIEILYLFCNIANFVMLLLFCAFSS